MGEPELMGRRYVWNRQSNRYSIRQHSRVLQLPKRADRRWPHHAAVRRLYPGYGFLRQQLAWRGRDGSGTNGIERLSYPRQLAVSDEQSLQSGCDGLARM